MKNYDTESTTLFLRTFTAAWQKCIDDYESRRINSEHCLQASLYRHLANALPEKFIVYAEVPVKMSESSQTATTKETSKIDLLICEERAIIAAIELKFTPRGAPIEPKIKKDLTSLAYISNRRDLKERCEIEIPRFHSKEDETLKLEILSQRKLIFAAFCTKESQSMKQNTFWQHHKPENGYWGQHDSYPTNICVAMAYTQNNGTATADFFGPGFQRVLKD